MNPPQDNTFAEACYNQNSIEELQAALAGSPDAGDMCAWGIDANEWRAQIQIALDNKLADIVADQRVSRGRVS